MRYRESFTVFARKSIESPSGKIFYYRTYDSEGKRTTARSTGQTSKTAAKHYCDTLLKRGELIPMLEKTFGEYAKGW